MSRSIPAIEKILVIDDNANTRESYAFPIEAAARTPVILADPLGTLEEFLASPRIADAAVSDYHLAPGNYAFFDGATLVARWYKIHFPAILCTTFDKSNAVRFRSLRRWIPIVLGPWDLDPDSLIYGLEAVQRELCGDYSPARRPWRALIHFVEYSQESNTANVRVPGWGEEVVSLRAMDLPEAVKLGVDEALAHGDEFRCYATANLGAEANEDLYISDWEAPVS